MLNVKSNGNGHSHNLSPFDAPTLATDYDTELDSVYSEALELGIDLSQQRHQSAIAARKSRARDLVIDHAPGQYPQWFKTLKSWVTTAGNAVLLFLMTALVYIAPPVAIVALTIAEIQRVALGVQVFDPARRWYYSIAAMLGYLALLVIKASRNQDTSEQTLKAAFSLRLWARRIGYVTGVGYDWKARGITRSQVLDSTITVVGRLIIFFGTFGVLLNKLMLFKGAWYSAILSIFTDSDLVTFLAIVGGGVLTAGLLSALHFLVEFSYNRYKALVPEGSAAASFFDGTADIQAAEKQAELLYIKSLITKQKQQRQQS